MLRNSTITITEDIKDQPPAAAAEVLIESIKYMPNKRKQSYNKYKNNTSYFIIDHIDLVQFSSFLTSYKGIEGLSEVDNIQQHFNTFQIENYYFLTDTFYTKARTALRRFKISLKDEYEFNYSILINIIYINRDLVLYIINSAINYNARGFLKNITINRKDNPANAITKSTPNKALIEFINTNKIDIRIKG
ncbi:unnamed protein product [Diplocarpon coronariae]